MKKPVDIPNLEINEEKSNLLSWNIEIPMTVSDKEDGERGLVSPVPSNDVLYEKYFAFPSFKRRGTIVHAENSLILIKNLQSESFEDEEKSQF